MKLLATHVTRYLYSGEVSMCNTEVHLQPRSREHQTILEFDLQVSPTPDSLLSREDYFGNEVTFFSIAEPHRELIITSRCLADVIREIASDQRSRGFPGRSPADLRAEDDARTEEDSERDREMDAARRSASHGGP